MGDPNSDFHFFTDCFYAADRLKILWSNWEIRIRIRIEINTAWVFRFGSSDYSEIDKLLPSCVLQNSGYMFTICSPLVT